MIFIGDIACPKEKISSFLECVNGMHIFDDEVVVANLEANILERGESVKPLTLYNDDKITSAFQNSSKFIVSLANNHMYDYPELINRTCEKLSDANIATFGISHRAKPTQPSVGEQITPPDIDHVYTYEASGVRYAFFGHCWRLYTQTNANKVNDVKVVDSDYDAFIESVGNFVKSDPEVKVYCFMHWNYDLERLVMPMHRNIARALIDAGADGVIGSHSHVPQGAEMYKGKPIVYGLGNFYLPSGIYFDGKLKYPESSTHTYALQIKDDTCHILWFRTDCNGSVVEYECREPICGERIKQLSAFTEMSDAEYISYFKENRTKKLLVPVFVEYKGLKHRLQESFAINRVRMLRSIMKVVGK